MDDPKHKSIVDALLRKGGVFESDIEKAAESLSRSMAKFDAASIAFPAPVSPRLFELPPMPTPEERNEYQGASVLMSALAAEALQWKNGLPQNLRPAIIAILQGGLQIQVSSLSQVSFHGIKVEGTLDGRPCSLLAHQATFQLLCYAEEIKPDAPRRPIGFIWEGHRVDV